MKAILVVNVPDDFETKDAIAIVDVQNEKGEGVIAMCPLKPMPQKIDISEDELYEKQNMCFEGGWNACLEEITGETE